MKIRKYALKKFKKPLWKKKKIQLIKLSYNLPQYYLKLSLKLLKLVKFKPFKFKRGHNNRRRRAKYYALRLKKKKKLYYYIKSPRQIKIKKFKFFKTRLRYNKKKYTKWPLLLAKNLTANLLCYFSYKRLLASSGSEIKDGYYLSMNKSIKFLIKSQVLYLKKKILLRQSWYNNKHLANLKLKKKRLKRWTNRYRKIKKSSAYNKIVFQQFLSITGLNFISFKQLWLSIKRSNNHAYGINKLIDIFTIRLLLLPVNLLFLTKITTTVNASKILIKYGAVICNGQLLFNNSMPLNPGDILQLFPILTLRANLMFRQRPNQFNSHKLNYYPFIYFDSSLWIITLLRYPFSYELIHPSFLSARWVRYFIRRLHVKKKQFIKINNLWKLYLA